MVPKVLKYSFTTFGWKMVSLHKRSIVVLYCIILYNTVLSTTAGDCLMARHKCPANLTHILSNKFFLAITNRVYLVESFILVLKVFP